MSRSLVVFYSYEGSTKKVAEVIAKSINAEILEIKPVNEMKSKGFGKYVWGGSQVVMGKTPELLPLDKNINDYDVVIVGSPVWAGTYTPPVKTLLEGDYIKGKKVAYFCCHEGGLGKANEKAKTAIEKNNTFISAKDFLNVNKNISENEEKAKRWANEIINV